MDWVGSGAQHVLGESASRKTGQSGFHSCTGVAGHMANSFCGNSASSIFIFTEKFVVDRLGLKLDPVKVWVVHISAFGSSATHKVKKNNFRAAHE